jgi:hypothetical protein
MPTIGSKSAFERGGELYLSEANANKGTSPGIACASDWGGDDRVRSLQSQSIPHGHCDDPRLRRDSALLRIEYGLLDDFPQ